MFNGIIHQQGKFKGYRRGRQELAVEASPLSSKMETGDSLAVDGVCLSLIRKEKDILYFNLSRETLQRTTLGSLKPGQRLNLELPLTLTSGISGHLVTGHVDGKGKVLGVAERRPGKRLSLSFPPQFRPYFILKGSVAVNGVSLTVAALGSSSFEIELIPITLQNSNLGELKRGDEVNIECDIIGKYVYNWLRQGNR